MTSERFRMTRFIWGVLAAVMIAMLMFADGTGLDVGHVILGIVLCLGAVGGTVAIWASDDKSSAEQSAKAKGGDRVSRLLNQLSDEDIAHLRERLEDSAADYGLGQDGELVRLRRK